MKVLVFGAGGVGSVVGGFLTRTGHDVSLLGRAWHLDVIEKQGLLITGIWGDYRIKAMELYRTVDELKKKDRIFDLIILTVKSYDTAVAVRQLLPLMQDKTMLLSLQNGLGNIETILEAGVRPENYLVGRVISGFDLSPGLVNVTVHADSVRIGSLPGVTTKLSAFQMSQMLNASRIPAEAVGDILKVLWAKVIYNCALNGICSLREIPYGKILEDPETERQMEDVIRECYAIGRAKAVALDPSTADEFIRLMKDKLIPSTATHHPSMSQDLRRGRRTEIDALNGAIENYGKSLGVPTPANTRIAKAIRIKGSPITK